MKRALVLLIVLPALAILAAFAAFWLLWAGPGPYSEPKTIIVEQGASVARVAAPARAGGRDPRRRHQLPRLRPACSALTPRSRPASSRFGPG